MKRVWRYLLYGSVVIVGGSLFFILLMTFVLKNSGFEGKTLWDWMELLIIPLFLAGGAFYLNRSERAVERQTADDRAKLERELATDRQQEAALQAYLDRMSELLLDRGLHMTENEEVRNVARIRTLTVLRGLDATRKGLVIKFLYEAELIIKLEPVIRLFSADLQGADLRSTYLNEVNFQGANLIGAKLEGATLKGATIEGANLQYADLAYADLTRANLKGADLQTAILNFSNLNNANLQNANLRNAKLIRAQLEDTDLQYAYLWDANLEEAGLFAGTKLQEARLVGVNLKGAKVDDAVLEGLNLVGVTMPDGTVHE